MKITLFSNDEKQESIHLADIIQHFLTSKGIEVFKNDPTHAKKSNYIISLGGDGSLLHLIHRIGLPHPPIVGINVGSLGFLAEIPKDDFHAQLEHIIQNKVQISNRLVLEGSFLKTKTKDFAVNEIAIHRGGAPCLVDLGVWVDDLFLNTFSADGIIIATPSGSTAYSLSAGGPILAPDLKALVITPICPHTLSHRPLVIMPKRSIVIELLRGCDHVDVAFDGQKPFTLLKNEKLHVGISPHSFQLVSKEPYEYFQALRTKLGWTGSLRNQSC